MNSITVFELIGYKYVSDLHSALSLENAAD